jgi:hypothetical protein
MANLDSSASSAPGTTPSARPNVARPPSFLSRVSSNHGPWLLLLGVITLLLCLYALQTAHEKKKFLRAAQQTTVTAAKYARSAQASAVWVAEQLDRLEGSITDARRAETSLAIPIAEYEARQRGIERRIQRAVAAVIRRHPTGLTEPARINRIENGTPLPITAVTPSPIVPTPIVHELAG